MSKHYYLSNVACDRVFFKLKFFFIKGINLYRPIRGTKTGGKLNLLLFIIIINTYKYPIEIVSITNSVPFFYIFKLLKIFKSN